MKSNPNSSIPLHRLFRATQLKGVILILVLCVLSLTATSLVALTSYAKNNLQLLSRSLAYSLEAAVAFDDADAAQESVTNIAELEDIAELQVYNREDTLLAEWKSPRENLAAKLERRFANLILPQPFAQPITANQGHEIGMLYITIQGATLTQFLASCLCVLLGCLVITTLLVLYLSHHLQQRVARPLQHLSQVVRSISQARTFETRVPSSSISELQSLADDFNTLLNELQSWKHNLQSENASLAHQANHDELTGLANRTQFNEALQFAMKQSKQAPGALLFMDCNNFKMINDELGHDVGDLVLTAIAQRLRHRLRKTDLVARLGGDEFAVLLTPIRHRSEALHIADQILDGMREPITLKDFSQLHVSLSIGIALYPEHAQSPERLLKIADGAMYHAKRNQYGRFLAAPTRTSEKNH